MFMNRYEAFRVHEEQEMVYCCFGTAPRINGRFTRATEGNPAQVIGVELDVSLASCPFLVLYPEIIVKPSAIPDTESIT